MCKNQFFFQKKKIFDGDISQTLFDFGFRVERVQLNLHFEKSISGCCSMNFLRTSCFFCSSLVGSPSSFCRWSYIIFSTKPRVSPSKSDNFDGSGLILRVEISGSVATSRLHQFMPFNFSKLITIVFPSWRTHIESSVFTSLCNSPSIIGGWPFSPTNKDFFPIFTVTSRGRTVIASGTFNFTRTWKKWKARQWIYWIHLNKIHDKIISYFDFWQWLCPLVVLQIAPVSIVRL